MIKCPSPSKCTGSDSHRIGTFCKARGRTIVLADAAPGADKKPLPPHLRAANLNTPKQPNLAHSRPLSLAEAQYHKEQARGVFHKLSEKPGLSEDDKKLLSEEFGEDYHNRSHKQAETALAGMRDRYQAIGFDDTEEDREAEAELREAEEYLLLSQNMKGQYTHVHGQVIKATINVFELSRDIIENMDGNKDGMKESTRAMELNTGIVNEKVINSFLESTNKFLDQLDEAGGATEADQYKVAKIKFAQRTLENTLDKPERLSYAAFV